MYIEYINVNIPQEKINYPAESKRQDTKDIVNVAEYETKYILKQKVSGLFLIVIGIISAYLSGEGTAFVFFAFIGIFLLLTKEKVMMFEGWEQRKEVE